MNAYLMLLLSTIVIAVVFFLGVWLLEKVSNYFLKKLHHRKEYFYINKLKVFAVFIFIAYSATLGYGGVFSGMDFAIDKYYYLNSKIFSPSMTILMVLLRLFTAISVSVLIISPFYNSTHLKRINQFILPIVSVLNVIFLNEHIVAIFGKGVHFSHTYRGTSYIIVIAGLLVAAVYHVYTIFREKIFNKETKFNFKFILSLVGLLACLMILFLPEGSIFVFFNKSLGVTKNFTNAHRIWLLITCVAVFLPYLIFRKKDLEARKIFFGIASLAGFFQYFYVARTGLGGLPLHLCNTAIVLMFIAYVFKFKGVFYFSYFVNVLGALFAIILPNTELHANHIRTIHFWYNHILAFGLPILGVALGIYERPNLKMMLRTLGFFSIYFFTTVVLNAWFNSEQFSFVKQTGLVDYFFTYSDFFVDKIEAAKPLYEIEWIVNIGGYDWKFLPVYQLAIYVVFIALMFVIWVVYEYLYQVSDRHYALLQVKKMRRNDLLSLRKLLKEGKISDPLYGEAIGMIKIEHFTKQYAGAKKPSVEDFSLEIHDGEVFGFIGHNGSGKSTTIKSIVGIQSITSGSIIIDGYDIARQPLEAKLRIGYVSDNHAVYEKLTGREYVNYVADLYLVSQEDRNARIEKYVKMFNLEEAFDREIKGYSHGMKQKLVVIASLIHNPKVWILDEPLTGLDPTSAYQIKECMREHANNGNIVFFSSHVIEVVEKICDKICIIQRGKLVGVYDLKELSTSGITLEQLYMTHVVNANYNIDAPEATVLFENRKNGESE